MIIYLLTVNYFQVIVQNFPLISSKNVGISNGTTIGEMDKFWLIFKKTEHYLQAKMFMATTMLNTPEKFSPKYIYVNLPLICKLVSTKAMHGQYTNT